MAGLHLFRPDQWVACLYTVALLDKSLSGTRRTLVPFGWVLARSNRSTFRPETAGNISLPRLTPWLLALLAALAFFLRFYKLSSFSTWPSTDEAWVNSYSLDLYEKWDWSLLYGHMKVSPFCLWIQAILFKILSPSLFSFYLLPALISCLTVVLSYAAAREFFSKPFALLCALITAFSFWPLLLGRIALGGGLIPGLELITLILLSRILKSKDERSGKIFALLLGLVSVSGFYFSHPLWAAYWIWLQLFILWLGLRREKFRKIWVPYFLLEAVLLIPLAAAFLHEGVGKYIAGLAFMNQDSVWLARAFNPLSYLTSLLWGADESGFIYRPQWGGFLNPVSGAFFLFGLTALIRCWKNPFWRWVTLALPVLLLPGLLSKTYEMYRIVAVLPLVVMITAMGVEVLFKRYPKRGNLFLLLFLIALSLDSYHLFGAYRQTWAVPGIQWQPFKSLERWRAFEILDKQNKEKGPGLILPEFVVRNFDRSLDVAVYSFNRARNRSLNAAPQWVGVIFPSHLQPYLSRRFPNGKWVGLSEGLPPSDENKCLGIIPVSPANERVFAQWESANRGFEAVSRQMLYSKDQMTFQELERALLTIQPAMEKDPFLESCFDQKISGVIDAGAEPAKALFFARRGAKYGYPSPFFTKKISELKKRTGLK